MTPTLKITPPTSAGRPAVLDCTEFSPLDAMIEKLDATWAKEFPSVGQAELGKLAGATTGFERFYAMFFALGFAHGRRDGRTTAAVENAVIAARATVKPPEKTFAEHVSDQMRGGLAKVHAVRSAMASHPEAYQRWLAKGGGHI